MSVLDVARTSSRGLQFREENFPIPFEDMNGSQQRMAVMYYFLDEKAEFIEKKANDIRASLGDWLKPKDVYEAWRSNDGTKLLDLISRAFERGLASKIDKENERE